MASLNLETARFTILNEPRTFFFFSFHVVHLLLNVYTVPDGVFVSVEEEKCSSVL